MIKEMFTVGQTPSIVFGDVNRKGRDIISKEPQAKGWQSNLEFHKTWKFQESNTLCPDICFSKGIKNPTLEIIEDSPISDHHPILLKVGLLYMRPPNTVVSSNAVEKIFCDKQFATMLMS